MDTSFRSVDVSAGSPMPAPESRPAGGARAWMDQWLPAAGRERTWFLVVAGLTLALKFLAIIHYRADSDETQHAHVVWGWARGKLQYRDLFDNHMPLFQILFGPVMRIIGERADVMIWLRLLMAPFYLLSIWAVYRITERLYSRRAAAWSALLAATSAKFFYTSTEFRTDDMWAALWLLGMLVAVGGEFTMSRALALGLVIGLAFAVSLKTVVLLIGLALAAAIALAIAISRGFRMNPLGIAARALGVAAGAAVAPAAVVAYFYSQGAFWIMKYCVIDHNVVPGLKRWGHMEAHQWYLAIALPFLSLYGWMIFRQEPETKLAMRRTAAMLMPWIFFFTLWSYWPDITREDDLPYTPLIPLSLAPLAVLTGVWLKGETWRTRFWTIALPALALVNFASTFKAQNVRSDRLRVTTHSISVVSAITKPGDYVMDSKGDYVYRDRAYYWVLEPITKARIRNGMIKDNLPQRLVEHRVKVCYLYCVHAGSVAAQFIVANYVPFDIKATDIGVLGQEFKPGTTDGVFHFDIAIPETYAVVTESGKIGGELDGKPYTGPAALAVGPHEFHRTGGEGRAGIILADAAAKGYSVLFNVYEHKTVPEQAMLPAQRQKKGPELQ